MLFEDLELCLESKSRHHHVFTRSVSPVAFATFLAVLSRIEFVLRLLALSTTDRGTWTVIVNNATAIVIWSLETSGARLWKSIDRLRLQGGGKVCHSDSSTRLVGVLHHDSFLSLGPLEKERRHRVFTRPLSPVTFAALLAVLSNVEFVLWLLALSTTDRGAWTVIVRHLGNVLFFLMAHGFMSDSTAIVVCVLEARSTGGGQACDRLSFHGGLEVCHCDLRT